MVQHAARVKCISRNVNKHGWWCWVRVLSVRYKTIPVKGARRVQGKIRAWLAGAIAFVFGWHGRGSVRLRCCGRKKKSDAIDNLKLHGFRGGPTKRSWPPCHMGSAARCRKLRCQCSSSSITVLFRAAIRLLPCASECCESKWHTIMLPGGR